MNSKVNIQSPNEVISEYRKGNWDVSVKKLIVKFKDVYGRELIYPVNETATLFAKLLNSKAFTRAQLEIINKLGFEIEVEKEELTFGKKGK